MKHEIDTRVKVTSAIDDTSTAELLNKCGVVTGHNTNGATGNTESDPLHIVEFEDSTGKMFYDSFWYEELTPINKPTQTMKNAAGIKAFTFWCITGEYFVLYCFDVATLREHLIKNFSITKPNTK